MKIQDNPFLVLHVKDFNIPDEEYEALCKWQDKHNEIPIHKGKSAGELGDRYSYILTPTSIGLAVRVKCD